MEVRKEELSHPQTLIAPPERAFEQRQAERELEKAELQYQLGKHSSYTAAIQELQLLLAGFCTVGFASHTELSYLESFVITLLQVKNQQFPYYSAISNSNEQLPASWRQEIQYILAKAKLSKDAVLDEKSLRLLLAALQALYGVNIDKLTVHTPAKKIEIINSNKKKLADTFAIEAIASDKNSLILHPAFAHFQGCQAALTARVLELLVLHTNVLEIFFTKFCGQIAGKPLADLKVAEIRQLIQEALMKIDSCSSFIQLRGYFILEKQQHAVTQLFDKVMEYLVSHNDSEYFSMFRRSCSVALENVVQHALLKKIASLKSDLRDESLNQMEQQIAQLELLIDDKQAALSQQYAIIDANESTIRTKKSELKRLAELKEQQLGKLNQMIAERQAKLEGLAEKFEKKQAAQKLADMNVQAAQQTQVENMQRAHDLAKEKQDLERQRNKVNDQISSLQKNIDALNDQKAREEVQKNRLAETKVAAEQNKRLIDMVKDFATKIKDLAANDGRLYQHRLEISQKMSSLLGDRDKLNTFKSYLVNDVGLNELANLPLPKVAELSQSSLERPIFFEYVNRTFELMSEIFRPAQPGSYDVGEYCFTVQGFDISWSDCKKQLHQQIRDLLAVYGFTFSADSEQRLLADKMTGNIVNLPEPLIKLIEERLQATRRPDLFPSQDSAINWHLRTAGEHEKADIIACLNSPDMQITLDAIMPYFIHRVNIIAGNHIYVDENIRLPGIDLTLLAKHNIYLNQSCIIDTSGESGLEFTQDRARAGDDADYQRRDNNEYRGRDGEHGLFGLAGMPGGHIYLSAAGEIINQGTLTCNSSGGHGAKGQEGGHGGQGKDGVSTPPANADPVGSGGVGNTMAHIFASGAHSETVIAEARIPGVGANQNTESEQTIKERSGMGGHGGKGGRGGYGGAAGEIKLIDKYSGEKSAAVAKHIANEGRMGADPQGNAHGGTPGQPGFLGISTANSNDGPKKQSKGIRGMLGGKKTTDRTRHGYYDMPKIIGTDQSPEALMGFRVTAESHYTDNYSHQYKLSYWMEHLPEAGGPRRSTDRRSICGEDRSQQIYGLASETQRLQKKARSNKMTEQTYRRELERQVGANATLDTFTQLVADHDAKAIALSAELEQIEAEIATKNLSIENLNQRVEAGIAQKTALENNHERLEQQIAQLGQNQQANQIAINQAAATLLTSLSELQQSGMLASEALIELQKAERQLVAILAAKQKYEMQHKHQESITSRAQFNAEGTHANLLSERQNLEQNLSQLRYELNALKQRYALANQESRVLHAQIDDLQDVMSEVHQVATQQAHAQFTAESEIKSPPGLPEEKLWQESDAKASQKIVIQADALAHELMKSIGKSGHESKSLIVLVEAFFRGGKLSERVLTSFSNWLAQVVCEDLEVVTLWKIAARIFELLPLENKGEQPLENIINTLLLQIEQVCFRWLLSKAHGDLTSTQQQALWRLLQQTIAPPDVDVAAHRVEQIKYCGELFGYFGEKFTSGLDTDADDLLEMLEFAPGFSLANPQSEKPTQFVALLERLGLNSDKSVFSICDLTRLSQECVSIETLSAIILHEPLPAAATQYYRIYCFFARLFVRECSGYLKAVADDPSILLTILRLMVDCLLKLQKSGLMSHQEISSVIDQSMQNVTTLSAATRAQLIALLGSNYKIGDHLSDEDIAVKVILQKLCNPLALTELVKGNDVKAAVATLDHLKPFGLDRACLQDNINQFIKHLRVSINAYAKPIQAFLRKLLEVFATYTSAFDTALIINIMHRILQLTAATKEAGREQEDAELLRRCKHDLLNFFPQQQLDSQLIANASAMARDLLTQRLMQLMAIAELELYPVDKENLEANLNAFKRLNNLGSANYATILLLDDYLNADYIKQIESRVTALQEDIRKFQTEMLDLNDLVAKFIQKEMSPAKQKFVEYCVMRAKILQVANIEKINSLSALIDKINEKTLVKASALLNQPNDASLASAMRSFANLIDKIVGSIRGNQAIDHGQLIKEIKTALDFCQLIIPSLEDNHDVMYTLYNQALFVQEYLERNFHSVKSNEVLLDNLSKLEFSLKTFCYKPNFFNGYHYLIAESHNALYQDPRSSVIADHPLAKSVQAYEVMVESLPLIKRRFGQFTFLTEDGVKRKTLFDSIMATLVINDDKIQELRRILTTPPVIEFPAQHNDVKSLQYYARVYQYLLTPGVDLSLISLLKLAENLQKSSQKDKQESFYYARLVVLLNKILAEGMQLPNGLSEKVAQINNFSLTNPYEVLDILAGLAQLEQCRRDGQFNEYNDEVIQNGLGNIIRQHAPALVAKAASCRLLAAEKNQLLFWLKVLDLFDQKATRLAELLTAPLSAKSDRILARAKSDYLHAIIHEKFAGKQVIISHLAVLVDNISEHLQAVTDEVVFANLLVLYNKIHSALEKHQVSLESPEDQLSCATILTSENFDEQEQEEIMSLVMTHLDRAYWQGTTSPDKKALEFNQPIVGYLPGLKSQYWLDLCQKWFDVELEKVLGLDGYKVWLIKLLFTDRLEELTIAYNKLNDMIKDITLKSKLMHIYECKKHLIFSYSLAVANVNEIAWLNLVASLDHFVQDSQLKIGDASKLLSLAIKFDLYEQIPSVLARATKANPVQAILLDNLRSIVAARESASAIAQSLAFNKLQESVFSTQQGLDLLEILFAAFAKANRENYVVGLNKLNQLVEQIFQINLYDRRKLYNLFEDQPILIWHSLFERIQLADRLGLDLKQSNDLLEELLTIKAQIDPGLFDQLIQILHKNFGPREHLISRIFSSDYDQKYVVGLLRELAEDMTQINASLLHALSGKPLSEWSALIGNRPVDTASREINKLVILMRESAINNDPIMQKLLVENNGNGSCRMQKLYAEVQNTYQAEYRGCDEAILKAKLAEFLQKNSPLLSENMKGEGEEALFDRQLTTLLALIQRAVQLREPKYIDDKNIEREVTFFPNQLAALIGFIDSIRFSRSLVANIDTGQGKSLLTRVMAIIHVLRGEKIDIISSGKHLAERDAENSKALCDFFAIKVTNNCDAEASTSELVREERYNQHQIIYGDTGSFQMDYLLTRYLDRTVRKNQSDRVFVDEVDSAIIDNMDKVLYISHTVHDLHNIAEIYYEIWRLIHLENFEFPTPANIQQVMDAIGKQCGLGGDEGQNPALAIPSQLRKLVSRRLRVWVENAYTAKFMKDNEQYSEVKNGQYANKVLINDTNTGVEQVNSQWSNGLHQFLQIKHLKAVSDESLRAVFISNKTYFSMYAKGGKMQGLSGTVGSEIERKLQKEIYDLEFMQIPRNIPRNHRIKAGVINDSLEKWYDRIIHEILEITAPKNPKRRATLVVFQYKSQVAELIKRLQEKYPDSAKDILEYSSYIDSQVDTDKVSLAEGKIVVATNIAGRGTDLKLTKQVIDCGGLHLIKTYIPEKLRTDIQIDGRASRNDMPGSSRYIVHDVRARQMPITVKALLEERNELERIACARIRETQVPQLEVEETLMHRYAALRADLKKLMVSQCDAGMLEVQLAALQNAWSYWFDKHSDAIKNVNSVGHEHVMELFEQFKRKMIAKLQRNADMLAKFPSELMSIAQYHMAHKNYARAAHYFQLVIDQDPDHSGFAYYYWAAAVMESGTSYEQKADFVKLCKKAKMAFAAANSRLQSQNIAAEEVAKRVRLSGKGQSINTLSQTNADEMGMYLRHIDAIDKMIGKDLQRNVFQNGEAIDQEVTTIYRNISKAMTQYVKDFRFTRKLKLQTEVATGVRKLILPRPSLKRAPTPADIRATEQEVTLPSRYFYCQEQFMQYCQHYLAEEDQVPKPLSSRQLHLIAKQPGGDPQPALADFILTQDRFLTLLKPCLLAEPPYCFSDDAWKKISIAKKQLHRRAGVLELINKLPLDKLDLDLNSSNKLAAILKSDPDNILSLTVEQLRGQGVALSDEEFGFLRQLLKIYGCWQFDLFGLPIVLANNEQHYVRILAETIEKIGKIINLEALDIPKSAEHAIEEILGALIAQGAVREPKVNFPKIAPAKYEIEERLKNIKNEIHQRLENILGAELYGKFNDPKNNRVSQLIDSISQALESTIGSIQTIPRIELKAADIKLFYEKGQIPPILLPYIQQGLTSVLSLVEKPPKKKGNGWGAFCVAVLGAAQIIAGAIIISTCPAFAKVGEALIQQGIGDIIFAAQSYMSGNFSWDAYLKYKKQSLIMSALTLGVQAGLSETGLAIPASNSVPASTFIYPAIRAAAINLAIDAAKSHLLSDVEEKIAEMLADEFAKSFDDFSRSEGPKVENMLAELFGVMGFAEADRAVGVMLSDRALNQFVSEQIAPSAMAAAKEAAARISAIKQSPGDHSALSTIVKVAQLVSQCIVVPEYLNKIETIKRNTRQKLQHINSELKSRIESLTSRGHKPQEIDESELQVKAKDAAAKFMQRLGDQIKEKVRQIMLSAGHDIIAYAIESKRREAMNYVSNAADEYFGMVNQLTDSQSKLDQAVQQRRLAVAEQSLNHFVEMSLQDLVANISDAVELKIQTVDGERTAAELQQDGHLRSSESRLIAHNSQNYLVAESFSQSEEPLSFIEQLQQEATAVNESKEPLMVNKPGSVNTDKKKYHQTIIGNLGAPRDPKSGRFVKKSWDKSNQGLEQKVEKKPEFKAKLFKDQVLLEGNFLAGHQSNLLGENSKQHIGVNPYARYSVQLAGYVGKDGLTLEANFTPIDAGVNVVAVNTADWSENFKIQAELNALTAVAAADATIALSLNPVNPKARVKLEGKAIVSAVTAKADIELKYCLSDWCAAWKPEAQAHLFAAGVKVGTDIELHNNRYTMSNELGLGAGVVGLTLKHAVEVYPQEPKVPLSTLPTRSYEDIRRQFEQEQQEVIRADMGEQRYRQQINTYGKEALNQRFFGPRGIYNTPSAYYQRRQQYEMAEKFKPNPCATGPCIYAAKSK